MSETTSAPWMPGQSATTNPGTPIESDPVPEAADDPTPFECATCGRRFKSKGGLATHVSRQHSKKPRRARSKKSAAKIAPVAKPGRRPATIEAGAVLSVLRPNGGIPSDAELIERIGSWVKEGRALYELLGK